MTARGQKPIALDAMGGDRAPEEIVQGGLRAARELGIPICLVGDRPRLEALLSRETVPEGLTIEHAPETVTMEDHAAESVRRKRQSSIVVGARLVAGGAAAALVSAGNTGAAMAASLFYIGRLPGVDRPAIAIPLPTRNGFCLVLDAGANAEVRPEHLVQFARMGRIYAQSVFGIQEPRVGLLNVGEEPTKGTRVAQEAHALLSASPGLGFIGNVEGKDVPSGVADVVVCDGFVGNIVLKLAEGVSAAIFDILKRDVFTGWRGALGGLLLRPALRAVKARLDYAEYGGAPLLGVKGVVIIAHGRSDRRAIFNAIKAAAGAVAREVPARIADALAATSEECEARA
ncbi:MAG TPA: phosphate acyltransferase PlsX [Limnochordales bacterium]